MVGKVLNASVATASLLIYSHRYFGPRRLWDCRGASNLDELHRRLSQIMIRRLKAEVLTQLPPKIRQRIPFDLPKEAAKVSEAALSLNPVLIFIPFLNTAP